VEPLLDDVDRFDRVDPLADSTPRRRRDWYWFLGRLGQSLIVLGLLMFLFVGYQLWGTGIEESQAQNRLEDQFRDLAVSTPAAPIVNDVPDTTPTTGDLMNGDSSPELVEAEPTFTPVVVEEGDPVAVIDIPDLGVTKYVVAGVAASDLKKGPGHYPMTPQPGHLGNVAIAGHRTTYGEPFRDLDELETGDDIVVTDVAGRTFYYRVTESFVVQPEDSWVVATTDPSRALLTLTTCHPEFSAKQRLIVTAELDTTRSTTVDDRPFRYATGPVVVEASESTIVADDIVSTTEAPIDSLPASEPDPLVTPDVDVAVDVEIETFSEGWFSDPAAWPHVLGWTFVLLLVVFAGWYVHRRFASRLLAVTVAVAPFFVVLYFVFQNVNRLLPPNL
jgi:sortase A